MQKESRERVITLLLKHMAEVDVIEKDTLQGWPEVSTHSCAGDMLTAELWVETAVCMFFLPALQHHLSYSARPPF